MVNKSKLLEKGRYYLFQQESSKTMTIRLELKPTKSKARFITLGSYKKPEEPSKRSLVTKKSWKTRRELYGSNGLTKNGLARLRKATKKPKK